MGQRANLVIGNASGYQLYYNHWCANTLPRDLFWGPEHALNFVAQQRSVTPEEGWLNTTWAEGGAVIDPQNTTVLLYGGDDILCDVPSRRLFLEMMGAAWEGWTVQWAHAGIVDIAEYVGISRDHVLAAPSEFPEPSPDLRPPEKPSYLKCLCSIQTEDGVSIYPLEEFPIDYVEAGPTLLEHTESARAYSNFDTGKWTEDLLSGGGLHIDVERRTMDFWMTEAFHKVQEIARLWEGWQVCWHKDQFERHEQLTGSALKYYVRPQADILKELLPMLDANSKPVDIFELAQRVSEREGGKKFEVSPFAARDDRLAVESDVRQSILARCVAALERGGRGSTAG